MEYTQPSKNPYVHSKEFNTGDALYMIICIPSSLIRGMHYIQYSAYQAVRNRNALYILIVHKLIHGIYDTI